MSPLLLRSLCFFQIMVMIRKTIAVLTSTSTDAVVSVNSSVTFSCQTDNISRRIRWQHVDSETNSHAFIYSGFRMVKRLESRLTEMFITAASTRESQLTINWIEPTDSGKYGCFETDSSEYSIYLELAVLDSEPVCRTNLSQPKHHVAQFEYIEVACIISGTGNLLSSTVCTSPLGLSVHHANNNAKLPMAKYTTVFQAVPPLPRTTTISCVIQFERSSTTSNWSSTDASGPTRTPSYIFNWTSENINFRGTPTEEPTGPVDSVSSLTFVITISLVMALLAALSASVVVIVITLRKRDASDIVDEDKRKQSGNTGGQAAVMPPDVRPASVIHIDNSRHHYHEISDDILTPESDVAAETVHVEKSYYEGLEPGFNSQQPVPVPVTSVYYDLKNDSAY